MRIPMDRIVQAACVRSSPTNRLSPQAAAGKASRCAARRHGRWIRVFFPDVPPEKGAACADNTMCRCASPGPSSAPAGAGWLKAILSHGFRPAAPDSTRGNAPRPLRGRPRSPRAHERDNALLAPAGAVCAFCGFAVVTTLLWARRRREESIRYLLASPHRIVIAPPSPPPRRRGSPRRGAGALPRVKRSATRGSRLPEEPLPRRGGRSINPRGSVRHIRSRVP